MLVVWVECVKEGTQIAVKTVEFGLCVTGIIGLVLQLAQLRQEKTRAHPVCLRKVRFVLTLLNATFVAPV